MQEYENSNVTLNLSVTVMSKLDAALLSNCCAVNPSPEYMMTCSRTGTLERDILPCLVQHVHRAKHQHLLEQSGVQLAP